MPVKIDGEPVAISGLARMLLKIHQQRQAQAAGATAAAMVQPPASEPQATKVRNKHRPKLGGLPSIATEDAQLEGQRPGTKNDHSCPTCQQPIDEQSWTPVDIVMTVDELIALTGYRDPGKQVAELHRQGYFRARRSRLGGVILERAHYDAVCRGQAGAPRPQLKPKPLTVGHRTKAAPKRQD